MLDIETLTALRDDCLELAAVDIETTDEFREGFAEGVGAFYVSVLAALDVLKHAQEIKSPSRASP